MVISLFRRFSVFVFILFVAASCTKKVPLSKFEEFEGYRSTDREAVRVPVILVPGIKGSTIKKGNKSIWGTSDTVARMSAFKNLLLEYTPGMDGTFIYHYNVKDRYSEGAMMDYYRIGFRRWTLYKHDIYIEIKRILKNIGGYCEKEEEAEDAQDTDVEHVEEIDLAEAEDADLGKCKYQEYPDLYTFSYDWRLDNRVGAARLAKKVEEVQKEFRKNIETSQDDNLESRWEKLKKLQLINISGCEDKSIEELEKLDRCWNIKVNLVAHSMGGLVSRYYLQMLGGDRHVNKLVLLGTPSRGAMDSLKALAEGELPESVFHFYEPENTRPIVFSWPSIFQLLPRYPGAIREMDETAPPVDLSEWGLTGEKMSKDGYNYDHAVKNWGDYGLIPEIPDRDATAAEAKAKEYLKYQLKDAYNFHQSINGEADYGYEKDKLIQVGELVKFDVQMQKSAETDDPIIVFGGNCERTLTYVQLDRTRKKPLVFAGLKGKSFSYGDGRVPVSSLAYPRKRGKGGYNFLICESHMGLVKNPTFQYNLLRELLVEDEI